MVIFSSDIPISIASMVLTGDRRGFAVRAYFENNQSVIALNFRVAHLVWPVRLPDLNICHYFLWRTSKRKSVQKSR